METLTVQMSKILSEYEKEVQEAVSKCTRKVAKETARELGNTSPKKTGEYASGWAAKKVDDRTAVTYNRKMPGLTHLLENGHIIRNKKGEYGRARPIKHIAPAAEKGADEFEAEIKRELG